MVDRNFTNFRNQYKYSIKYQSNIASVYPARLGMQSLLPLLILLEQSFPRPH